MRATRSGPVVRWLLACLVVLSVAGCNGRRAEPTAPPSGSRAVTFEASDGVKLAGRLFGDGRVGIVMSHMLPADQRSWWDFASQLADRGYLVLTYDARGYCPGGDAGCSAGEKDVGAIWQDVVGAVAFVRAEGAVEVVLMGASMGGTASLVASGRGDVQPAAIVTLSAPTQIEDLVVTPDLLARVSAPKLFVAGVGDAEAADAAQRLYDMAPQPKRVEILTSDDHGTDLLTGNQSGILRNMIETYLEQYVGG
jgi:pimeloyl-ACP methyl ester carboxylesterase